MSEEKKVLGSGRAGTVYLENGFAFKRFEPSYLEEWIIREVNLQNIIQQQTDLFVPKAFFDREKYAIKMDYINGLTLDQRIHQEEYPFALEDLIKTQLSTYQYQDLNLDDAHIDFKLSIEQSNLPNHIKEKALLSLMAIPEKNNLCHFDMHFLNIIYQKPHYYIIDWVNAKSGNPVMDIARSFLILEQYAQQVSRKYLNLIVKEGNFSLEEIHTVIPLMAALRVLENEDENFKEHLFSLIDTYS